MNLVRVSRHRSKAAVPRYDFSDLISISPAQEGRRESPVSVLFMFCSHVAAPTAEGRGRLAKTTGAFQGLPRVCSRAQVFWSG